MTPFLDVFLQVAHAAGLVVLIVYAMNLLAYAWLARRPLGGEAVLPEDGALPRVCVQIPLYNERNVVRRAIEAASRLDWPRDRLEIQVLDDSTDVTTAFAREEVQALVERGFSALLVHRMVRRGYKAGALEEGMTRSGADYFAVLDADFIAPPDFLRRAMSRLLADRGLGYVQARWGHLNAGRNALTRLQAMMIDTHFLVEQLGRAAGGLIVPFNGTCGIWRREAIETSGGWQHDTLTEDLDLSLRVAMAGWGAAFLPGLVVRGELPETLQAWRTQQFRWTKGFTQVSRKLIVPLWRSDLGVRRKLMASLMMTNWAVWPATVVILLTAIALAASEVERVAAATAVLGVTAAVLGVLGTGLAIASGAARAGREGPVRAFCRLPIVLGLNAGLLLANSRGVIEGLLNRASPFVRTPKRGEAPQAGYQENGDTGRAELATAAAAVFALFHHPDLSSPLLLLSFLGLALTGALLAKGTYAARLRPPLARLTAPRPGQAERREIEAAVPARRL